MNNFELNKSYSGFYLNEIIPVKEVNGTLYDMQHKKSGARLIYLDCDDNNKVFYVAFKTIPEDSTGVFHIIEHSVLCGSDKYPVKEPFVDLLKGSMNTFLNAMTYPDKTVYPCASCNDKDFANLMSVYMDAVFSPAIYSCDNIFRQEGHHIELFDKNDTPIIKGVVFNEMKGAFSSVDSRIYSSLSSALFPDTTYRFSSGGDPACIPDLTYEKFIESHKKYYSPDNSIIYLYGNMNLAERLEFLDREYLSRYEKSDNEIKIAPQTPVENMNCTAQYQISEAEELENNTYFAHAIVNSSFDSREKNIAYDVLFDALTASNDSPLKKIFIESKMGEDFSAYLSEGILHPYTVFRLGKTNEDKKEEFLDTLYSSLLKMADEGIDKKLLTASFNQLEFSVREGDTGSGPIGLNYGLLMLNSLLYGGRPETFLTYEKELDSIREGIEKGGYFEALIKELLESNHKAFTVVTPSREFTSALDKKERERVDTIFGAMSEDEKDALVKMNNDLLDFQSREDSAEAKATIPTLEISDIDTKAPLYETEIKDLSGYKTLHHPFNTKKISYLKLMFDLTVLTEEEHLYASLLSELLCSLGTDDMTPAELSTEIKTDLGMLSSYISYYTDIEDIDKVYPFFVFSSSVLDSKIHRAIDIIEKIINSTNFDKNQIEAILRQRKNRIKQTYIRNGTMKAVRRLSSYSTVSGRYGEIIDGYDYYKKLSAILDDYYNEFEIMKGEFAKICEKLFTHSGLTLSLTGSEEALFALDKAIASVKLGSGRWEKMPLPAPKYEGNEAFVIPSQVNYVASGLNIRKKGIEYSGKMDVLCQILRLDYMWNEVRVKGGAYGAGFTIRRGGDLYASSYRDPKVLPTLERIAGIKDYLKDFSKTHENITNYIISTAAEMTSPVSERDRGSQSDAAYFTHLTNEMNDKNLKETLSTTPGDIEEFYSLATLVDNSKVCAIGSEEALVGFDIVYKI